MKFCFVAHNHQPIGNFDDVINDATDRAYLPFLTALTEVPAMEVGLHYSGSLLQWARDHRPDLIEHLRTAADQVDFVGGGLHEPVLAAIPDDWRRRQIREHRELVGSLLEVETSGLWIAERLWEPTLAWLLADIDVGYTLLDDTLFDVVGAQTDRPAVVDHLGRTIRVLPISAAMRDLIPAAPVDDVLAALARINDANPHALVVMADDGEKFGAWTGSDRVRTERWLSRFFTEVVTADWIDVIRPSAAADLPAAGAALSAGSYSQMQAWLTETGQSAAAPWKHFLTRHRAAALMYRKMLSVAGTKLSDLGTEHVLAAQANDAYWHGSFGGVFHPHLRSAVHTNLVAARTDAERSHRGRSWADVVVTDWDRDGTDEIHAELPDQSWVLTNSGGLLYYDDKPARWCVSDIVCPGETDASSTVRGYLQDRWASAGTETDLTAPPSEVPTFRLGSAEASRGSVSVSMQSERDGWTIAKTMRALDRSVELTYDMTGAPTGRFGPELPIALWDGAGRIRVDGGPWTDIEGRASHTGHRFRIEHTGRRVQVVIDLRLPGTLDLQPIVTPVRTERGTESIHQGVIAWPSLFIEGDGTHSVRVSIVDVKGPEE